MPTSPRDAERCLETIRELCSFQGRLPGSDAERRAANHLARRLRALGRTVEVEPTHVHPQAPLVWAAHAALAFAGSLLAVAEPVAGFCVALVAATSLYLDLNGRLYLLRSLFFRRASQNVVSRGARPNAPARVILLAHYDTARTGAVFAPKQAARTAKLARALRFHPARLLFWSAALLVPLTGARMAGLESDAVALAQLPPTILLLTAPFLLVDIQLSRAVPGANDNASGVALALDLAERLQRDEGPDTLDVWIVLTGGHECGNQGARAFLRSRRGELDRASTYVIALDAVGAGEVRWLGPEGPAVSFEPDRRLAELCAAVATASGADGSAEPAPLRHGLGSEAFAARAQGWRAIALSCRESGAIAPAHHHTAADIPQAIDPAALDRARQFAWALIGALGREAGRGSAD